MISDLSALDKEESNRMNSDEDVDSARTDEKVMHNRKRDALNESLSRISAGLVPTPDQFLERPPPFMIHNIFIQSFTIK